MLPSPVTCPRPPPHARAERACVRDPNDSRRGRHLPALRGDRESRARWGLWHRHAPPPAPQSVARLPPRPACTSASRRMGWRATPPTLATETPWRERRAADRGAADHPPRCARIAATCTPSPISSRSRMAAGYSRARASTRSASSSPRLTTQIPRAVPAMRSRPSGESASV